MRHRSSAFPLGIVLAASIGVASVTGQSFTGKAERDEIASVARNDPTMAAAMREARAKLPDFLKLTAAPRPSIERFAVKVAVREGDTAEYFWINPFESKDGQFSGQLNNTPRSVKSVKLGDTIKFTEKEIVDWLYIENNQMKGNFTACALLKNESKQEREAFKKRFGLDCGF